MSGPSSLAESRTVLADLYWAAVRGAATGPALRAALEELDRVPPRVWILALGKAALPMASAAVEFLRSRGRDPSGGLIIAPDQTGAPHASLEVLVGDHPEPGHRSLAAAERLGAVVSRLSPGDEAWVLLSGGASSLAAGPTVGIDAEDLIELFGLLLGSGLDITAMNAIRKRFSRWGAGRLAAALAPAHVRNYVVSDVIGDDLPSIASGPCVPDDRMAAEIRSLLVSAALWERIPEPMRTALAAAERNPSLETPKSGDPLFANVQVRVVASNRVALGAAAARAAELGLSATVVDEPLTGEAAVAGATVGRMLRSYCGKGGSQPACCIWGGETTVTFGEGSVGRGGRCQELALTAARELAGSEWVTLLAAGTDGRDGPTDAAGAMVDGGTWHAVRARGRDPQFDLDGHDAYAALEAAGSLFRTGLTGTNVMDVVIAVCARGAGDPAAAPPAPALP